MAILLHHGPFPSKTHKSTWSSSYQRIPIISPPEHFVSSSICLLVLFTSFTVILPRPTATRTSINRTCSCTKWSSCEPSNFGHSSLTSSLFHHIPETILLLLNQTSNSPILPPNSNDSRPKKPQQTLLRLFSFCLHFSASNIHGFPFNTPYATVGCFYSLFPGSFSLKPHE